MKNPIHPMEKSSGKRECAMSQSFSVNEFKKVAKEHGATINDLVLACVSKALKRYILKINNLDETKSIITFFPASLRTSGSSDSELKNCMTVVNLHLPLPD